VVAASAWALGPRLLARLAPPDALAAQAPVAFACVLATVCLRMILSAFRAVVAGAQRLDLLGRIGSLAALLEGGLAAAILLRGGSLAGLAWNALCVACLTSAAEGAAARHLCPGLRLRPFAARRSDWREILSFGARLQAARAGEILAAHVPRLALALGPGLSAAGAYDLAARAAGLLNLAGSLPLPVVQPLASRLEARGERERLRSLVRAATRYVALLVVPAAILLGLRAPDMLLAWTGRGAPPGAVASLRWLAAAFAIALILSPLRLALRGAGLPGIEASATVAGAGLNLVLAVVLAPRLGAGGAALAAFAAAGAAAFILLAGAIGKAPDLVRGCLSPALRPLLLAGGAGVLAVAAIGALLPVSSLVQSGRLPAIVRIAPAAAALAAVMLVMLILQRAVGRDDLELLREALLLRRAGGGA
jgi:O-antigen/teichoic acid export membrane protein